MIEAATEPLRLEIERLRTEAVLYTQQVTLRSYGAPDHGGKLLSAEQGGPTQSGEEFVLTGKDHPGIWELWEIDRL